MITSPSKAFIILFACLFCALSAFGEPGRPMRRGGGDRVQLEADLKEYRKLATYSIEELVKVLLPLLVQQVHISTFLKIRIRYLK